MKNAPICQHTKYAENAQNVHSFKTCLKKFPDHFIWDKSISFAKSSAKTHGDKIIAFSDADPDPFPIKCND